MKKIFLFILLFVSITSAQSVYFCESYTENGKPIDASVNIKIKPGGQSLYILFDNKSPINDDMVYLFIDKSRSGKFEPFDSKQIDIREGRSWAVFEYTFKEEGEYKANFVNTKNQMLASGTVNIFYQEDAFKPNETYNTSYYDYSRIVFAQAVIDGKPFNESDTFNISEEGTTVFAYLNTGKALNTSRIKVEVYLDENGDREFDEHIDTKKFRVTPSWRDTFFRYEIEKPGVYKFEIYNDKNMLMASSFLKAI